MVGGGGGGGGGGGEGEGVGFAGGGGENSLILVRSSDRYCILLNMKMNKYLHQISFAVTSRVK